MFKAAAPRALLPLRVRRPLIGRARFICIDVSRGCRSILARAFIGSAAVKQRWRTGKDAEQKNTFIPLVFRCLGSDPLRTRGAATRTQSDSLEPSSLLLLVPGVKQQNSEAVRFSVRRFFLCLSVKNTDFSSPSRMRAHAHSALGNCAVFGCKMC